MADTKDDRYGLMTFAAPAGRTYFDRDGNLQTAAENEIREEYDPLTGAYLGMLIEQSSTNYIPNSSNLMSGWSTYYDYPEGMESVAGPDGNNTAVRVYPSKIDGSKGWVYNNYGMAESLNGNAVACSIWVKASSADCSIRLTSQNSGAGNDKEIGISGVWKKIDLLYEVRNDVSFYERLFVFTFQKNNAPTDDDYIDIWNPQFENQAKSSSPIVTNGSTVTRARDDARFTDPSVFNNFERGSFVVEYKLNDQITTNVPILGLNNRSKILGELASSLKVETYDEVNAPNVSTGRKTRQDKIKVGISFGNNKLSIFCDGQKSETKYQGVFGSKTAEILICKNDDAETSAHITDIQFHPELLTDAEMRRLITRDATTVISDCPDGGYYDYSDLSTLLIQSDESDIAIEDRMTARVGDPVGAILDKSGHGNHMTASTDDRRGVLRSDGELYWIEFNDRIAYQIQGSFEYSVTTFYGVETTDDQWLLITKNIGTSVGRLGGYVSNNGDSNVGQFDANLLKQYANGIASTPETLGESYNSLSKVTFLRSLFRFYSSYQSKFYLNGDSGGYALNGSVYGFAWATRLSEADAEIVERDMRRNMPELPSQ